LFGCRFRPDVPGGYHVVKSSKVATMRNIYSFRKRAFLDPISTHNTSYIFAHVQSTDNGEYRWGDNLLYVGDCRRRIALEFFLGNARARRISLKKINLLIDTLTSFRDALQKEIALIEKSK
jgi:hypothetical protein